MSYRIEDLDVYRRCVAAAAQLCRLADETAGRGSSAMGHELRRRGIAMASNLADGLGFWEKEEKERHFAASKKAVLEALSLMEITVTLKLVDPDAQRKIAVDLRDLAKMTGGLLRGARRREVPPNGDSKEARSVGEKSVVYH